MKVGPGAPRAPRPVATEPRRCRSTHCRLRRRGLHAGRHRPPFLKPTLYWKPVWYVLDESFVLTLANAAHVHKVTGRKTDVNDTIWLADPHAHGLIRASFVPPSRIQELWTLLRTHKQFAREKAQHIQRRQKTLEEANLETASVPSNTVGVYSRAILTALIAGEADAEKLAELVRDRLRSGHARNVDLLPGCVTAHHPLLLKPHLGQIDALDAAIVQVENEAGASLEPSRVKTEFLTMIPGVSEIVAQSIVAEIGVDLSRFPTVGHLISWTSLFPRNEASTGKRPRRACEKACSG